MQANIKNIDDIKGELIFITLTNNKIEYKGLTIIKSEIFSTPKKRIKIIIEEIQYKYDDNFYLRLYIKAKIIEDKYCTIIDNNKFEILNFNENCIINTLTTIVKIDKKLLSNLFIVNSKKEIYCFKCMENNQSFIIINYKQFSEISLKNNDIVFIKDFYVEKENNILLSPLSIIEKLTDEKFFFIFQVNIFIFLIEFILIYILLSNLIF